MRSGSVYAALPEFIQNCAVSIKGMHTNLTRYGADYRVAFEGMMERSEWSVNDIKNYRDTKLVEALERAGNSAYYSKFLAERDWNWDRLVDPKCFGDLPVISKSLLRENISSFRPRPAKSGDRTINTSGTTGESLTLHVSKNVDAIQWAVWWRYRSWHGINRGAKCALFASAPVIQREIDKHPWRFDRSSNDYRFSIFHISEKTAQLYVDELNNIQPEWIHGNPTAIAQLAMHILNLGLNIDLNIKIVSVGSENLMGWQKNVIESAFDAKVIQHYGLAEGVANISECEEGNLHIDEDFSFVELLDRNGSNPSLSIIGTPFDNFALSVLRYDTGDLASTGNNVCTCGHPGRIVHSLNGRSADYISLPTGERVASIAAPFHSCDGLGGAQIHQAKTGSLTVKYIPLRHSDGVNLSSLEHDLRLRLGTDIEINFTEVQSLEKTNSGKMKLVISEYLE